MTTIEVIDWQKECEKTLKENGMALGSILTAIKRGVIPKNLNVRTFYFLAVRQNPMALRYVPFKQRSRVLCYAAVLKKGEAFRHVPKRVKNLAFCKNAISRNWEAIKHCKPTVELLIHAMREQKRQIPSQLVKATTTA